MKVDLHCHSTNSDGTWSVEDILKKANQKKIEYLAITDHDNLDGSREAFNLKNKLFDGTLIAGIEISTRIDGIARHFLAYFPRVDLPSEAALLQNLEKIKNSRVWRMKEMLKKAEEIFDNFSITFEDVVAEAGEGLDGKKQPTDVISRPHLARLLFKRGFVSSYEEAFDYLGDQGSLYVQRFTLGFDDWISQVQALGGFMVWAHPLHGNSEKIENLSKMIQFIKNTDLAGVEFMYNYKGKYVVSDQFVEQGNELLMQLIEEKDLLITAGGDFHGNVGLLGETELDEENMNNFLEKLFP